MNFSRNHLNYLNVNFNGGVFLMNERKKWMLMTYYCPTHGDLGMAEKIEITTKEISKTFFKKGNNTK